MIIDNDFIFQLTKCLLYFFFLAYSKRCADKIDFVNTIRNKRGSAKRKLERKLAAKKENLNFQI